MKRLACLLLLPLLGGAILGQAAGEPELPQARRLTIATWNMLNLFDGVDEPGKNDEETPPKSWYDKAAAALVIDHLDADILGVEEVENRAVLEEVNRMLERPFLHVELIEGNDPRGIDCGILSRFPIEAATSHRLLDLPGNQRFARDFPVFRIRLAPDRRLDVGVMHLKSKRGDSGESDSWRLAEAQAIRGIIEERRRLEPKVPFVILGDFNDNRDSKPLAPLLTGPLVDATAKAPIESRVSFVYRGKGEQIDFVLATSDLASRSAEFLDPADNPSDHRPVRVIFDGGADLERPIVPAGQPLAEPKRPRIKATDLAALESHFLAEVEVEGRVEKVHRAKDGRTANLDMAADWKQALVAHVAAEGLPRFPKLDDLAGKRVRIRGPVSRYRGSLQIVVTRPEQLSIDD